MSDIQVLRDNARAAEDALRRIDEIIRKDIQKAQDAAGKIVRDSFSLERAAIVEEYLQSKEALDDALDAQAKAGQGGKFPVGMKVCRWERTGSTWQRGPLAIRNHGVIELVTRDSAFPENTTRTPNLGDTIIRVLKKNGEPGAKFETVGFYIRDDDKPSLPWGWHPEGVNPNEVQS